MKKQNILFKKFGAIAMSSSLLLCSINADAFTMQSQSGAIIEIEDNETLGTDNKLYIDKNITFDDLNPKIEQEQAVPIQEVDNMDDFQQEIAELNQDKELASDSAYAAKRLIVITETSDFDTYGPENILAYGSLYILSYASESDTRKAYSALSKNEDIISVEVDSIVETSSITVMESIEDHNSSDIPNSDSIQEMDEPQNDSESPNSPKGVTIAVIDSGIDKNNDLFADRIIDIGLNFSTSGEGIQDDNGHGTAVSSVIANNSGAYIMPIKIANSDGKGTVLGLYLAIKAAIDNNADIINLSMTTSDSELLTSVIEEAVNAGIKVIAAAGNHGTNTENYAPANIDSVIAVTALDTGYMPAEYTNFGNMIDYAAIGEMEADTLTGKTTMSGTSLSAAYVSAVNAYAMDSNVNFNDYVYPVNGQEEYYGKGIVSLEYVDVANIPDREPVERDPETTKLPVINYPDSITLETNILENYITQATNVTYNGNTGSTGTSNGGSQYGTLTYIEYDNTSADSSKYVVFENAVYSNGTKYDLVIYPFAVNHKARIAISSTLSTMNNVPILMNTGRGCAGYKLAVTQHGNINSPVSLSMIFGMSDIDSTEYYIVPSTFSLIRMGTNVREATVTNPAAGIRYRGATNASSDNFKYNTGAVLGSIFFPADGITIYYGHDSTACVSELAFNGEFLNYVYSITFDANGGSGTPDSIIVDGTTTSTVMGNIGSTVPTRTGYTFKGWSAAQTYSSTNKCISYSGITGTTTTSSSWTYANYCSYTGGSASSTTLTLYAQWEPVTYTYTINFNANGGSGTPSSITKTGADASVVMGDIDSTVPTRTGYTFKGWSASSSWSSKRIAYSSSYGGSAASDGTSATTTSSTWTYENYCTNTGGSSSSRTLTLYAQWEAIYTHTLTYNANGGSNAPSSSTVTNSSSTYNMTVSSSVPTRTGYTFSGWNTNSSGTGTNYSAEGSVSVGANATVTLYAKWTPITYSITYNGNGNTGGSTASQTKTYDVAINLQNNGFIKTGYHFTGWNTAANGTGTSYSAGASYNTNENLTLYAQWATNTSTLKVKPNGGTWNGSTNEQSFTQNYSTTKSIPVPTRTGYTFAGWTRTGTNGTMSSLTAAATYTFGTANGATDTITAGWQVNNYNVTYIDRIKDTTTQLGTSSTASKSYGSTVRGSDKGSDTTVGAYHTGYYYASDTSATVTTSGATVYRYFSPQNYTVTYIDRIKDTTTQLDTSSTASKPYGSTVRGSDKGSDTTVGKYHTGYYYVSDTSATVTTSGATVYRYFSPQNYTVTYIDRIKDTTTQLGSSSTVSKPYGSSVRGADKGSDTTVGKYHTGYYYVSDTSATVTTSGATVYRYFSPQNYTVTYIDRIKGTTTQLGSSSTASKPYGSTVRGTDKGGDTTAGKYHTGYYYVSDTSATVTTSGATVYRYFSPQNYTVTYIDVVDSISGKELGRSTMAKPYNSTVRGSDKGSSKADNAYYNGYYYESDTSATVTTSGATVYRIFKQRMNTIAGNIIWIDWNNKNLSRPSSVNLYISGSDGSEYSYVITGSSSQNTSVNKWPYSKELPKYDSNGNVITYTVSQDRAISQEEGLTYKDPDVNGYDVTNEITNVPEDYIKIPVTITWNDDNNQYGFRPAAVTLQLLRNGTVVKTISTSGNYTFTELLKYDSNGDLYAYTIQASDEDRYTKTENNAAPYSKSVTYTFIKPAYSVIIPKIVILDGNTGIGEYVVSVKGQIDDRDFVNVIPDKSFTMKNDYLSPITATVKQNRTVFTNKENIKAGAISNGTITTKSLAGRWSGSFNFNIYFEFGR